MTEVLLFIVVGGIAVAAAVMMLLSENAVHSALFLIVNFACVAFFYLMLNAPFLAMVQIAVYAGAIMVLFLFVIMLLGAEKKLSEPSRKFPGYTLGAVALGLAFLFVAYYGITSGQIDLQGPVNRPATLRIIHLAPDAGPVDVYANGGLLAEGVVFGDATPYQEVPMGEYAVTLNQAGTDTALLSTTITLVDDPERRVNAFSALAYGEGQTATVSLITDNLETTEARTGRITVFNAFAEPISLVDFASQFDMADDRVLVDSLAPGAQIEIPPVMERNALAEWAFVRPGNLYREGNNAQLLPDVVLFRLNDPDVYRVERNSSTLLILAGERLFDDSLRAVAEPVVTHAASSFGGPHAIGELLFTRYMLPLQLVAILLLVAMIGAIVLTHREDDKGPRRRDVRRKVSQPIARVISAQVGQDVFVPRNGDDTPKLPAKEPEQPEPAGD